MWSCLRLFAFGFLLLSAVSSPADTGGQATILYDAFGDRPSMKRDWGFAVLIEYHGKRILFDTGNNARTFADNVDAAGVDLRKLDFVVISHRHLDHTAGLSHLLAVNPGVTIYAPKEAFGAFGSSLPSGFYRKDESLPEPMRYYGGRPPDTMQFGTAWVGANFELVEKTFEIAPGITILALVSEAPGTRELRELSLVLRTPQGAVLVVGCSHPGIDRIVEAATAIDGHLHVILGGFHLPTASDEQISRIAGVLHETFKVDRLAPGHCTGEPAFAVLRRMWGDQYIYAGLGSVIKIP
ncbi:MAG TPA: MBL fold metallo-hydrolase [Burkholderiales bacterium]|nr:MBL fold metallo-hydrolase [Burkholderiales bacterium]